MSDKLKSRKFWVAIVGQIVGIVALVAGAAAAQQVEIIAGAVIMIATALGYLKAEKDIDVAREGKKQ
jgi:uncharacterized membrane protein